VTLLGEYNVHAVERMVCSVSWGGGGAEVVGTLYCIRVGSSGLYLRSRCLLCMWT